MKRKIYVTPIARMAIVAALLTVIICITAYMSSAVTVEETNEEPAQAEAELICIYENVPLDIELHNYIVAECEKNGIRPEIIFAMIQRESEFNAETIGDNGQSFGLMQIQPCWHYSKMLELNCTNLLDEKQNVTVGISILADLIAEGKGIEWALMAYNAGASNADKMAAQSIVSDYAKDVINLAENWGRTYEYAG